MRPLSTGTNLAIFALFFGTSLLDAITTRNWARAAFWLVIALAFMVMSRAGKA